MSDESTAPVFLGVSHRAARRGFTWDLLGLTTIIFFPYFPQRLTGLQCVMGLNLNAINSADGFSYRLLLTDTSQPTNQAWTDQNLSLMPQNTAPQVSRRFAIPPTSPETGPTNFGWGSIHIPENQKSMELVPVPAPPLIIMRPCTVRVEAEFNGKRYHSGEFICGFAPPQPLSDEERRAIASRPGAAKSIGFYVGCKTCKNEIRLHSLLNPLMPAPQDLSANSIPIEHAPSNWSCECGKTSLELTYLKEGLHDLFRHGQPKLSEEVGMQFTPLYEAGRVQDLIAEYEQLIETATDEETIQKYLEDNPLLWAFLAPVKIMHKPSVLTKKKADFGILTGQKILFLIEIEKPTTRLANQDGSISAEIQRGANQIRDWQLVISDHKLALLSELGLKDSEVQEIRYLLIGGLARRSSAIGLTKIRRSPFTPNTEFYCFDELSSFLYSLGSELRRL